MPPGDPVHASPESPPVAAAEAENSAPLRVSGIEAVARSRLFSVAADAPLVEVAALLSSAQTSVVVVRDETGGALGIITETVLVRRLGLGQADFFATRAGQVLTQDFPTCAPGDLLTTVLATMHEHGYLHTLLIDTGNKLLGVVYARDGLRALLAAGNQEEALLRSYVMGTGYR